MSNAITPTRRPGLCFVLALMTVAPVLLAQEPSVKPAGRALPLGGSALHEERTDREIGDRGSGRTATRFS